jgi:pyruvate/2-oxoglutarate dehydrogenase complex dihydrolipoamide dehydrogenase (E3) component
LYRTPKAGGGNPARGQARPIWNAISAGRPWLWFLHIADPATRLLPGAHIIGPQASTLIQPLIQAMCLGNTADEAACGVLYIHPALTEVVEQALLEWGSCTG